MNISLWQSISKKHESYPALDHSIHADIAIIGGGITGITCALHLVYAGKKVIVIDANEIGGMTTGASTGNLYVPVQPLYQNIIKKFNLETVKTISQARSFAIDYIEKNIIQKNIKCNYARRPWYGYCNNNKRLSILENEYEAFQKIGLSVNYTKDLPIPVKFSKAIIMENQARLNPLQYVLDLAHDLKNKGCLLHSNTRAISVKEDSDGCHIITADGYKITSQDVVIATHTPLGVNLVQLFTAPYRSYVVAAKVKDNNYPEGHFWDFNQHHHSVCTHATTSKQPDLLLVAGSHHKTGQDPNMQLHFKDLGRYLIDHLNIKEFEFNWSAQHYHSADTIPYIGLANRFVKNTYMATGFFSDGLIYGTLGGLLVGDLILKRDNPWAHLFNSNRFTPKASAGFLLKENTNTFAQYYKDMPGPVEKPEDVRIGQAKVIFYQNEKLAVYRDEKKLHVVCAVCPHMKGIVNWNNAEKTWDCPCHGSRFMPDGKYLEGPAKFDLEKRET